MKPEFMVTVMPDGSRLHFQIVGNNLPPDSNASVDLLDSVRTILASLNDSHWEWLAGECPPT